MFSKIFGKNRTSMFITSKVDTPLHKSNKVENESRDKNIKDIKEILKIV